MENQSEKLDHQVEGYRVSASRLAESNFRYTQPCQGDCVLGVAHYQLSGYVTFPIPEKGRSPT